MPTNEQWQQTNKLRQKRCDCVDIPSASVNAILLLARSCDAYPGNKDVYKLWISMRQKEVSHLFRLRSKHNHAGNPKRGFHFPVHDLSASAR